MRGVLALTLAASPTVAAAQGARSGVAPVNGERLRYEVAGPQQGTPLVLIHGWSLHMGMWDPQMPALSRRHRVIRYDRRGFGQSTGSEDLTWDAADLAALLDQLGAPRAHVLGMSQGARVALQFARGYPERVASLVLHGDGEIPFLQIVARALAYYLPDARLAVVPGGGHMVNLIEQERYDAAVLAFLAGVERRPAR